MVDVIVDSREQEKSFFIASLLKAGIHAKVEALDAGDFLIYGDTKENSYLIERKESSDFLASLEGHKDDNGAYIKGRLWDQLKRMKESEVGKLRLIIEGDPLKAKAQRFRRKKITPPRIYGAYEGISNWGVSIIPVQDKYQTIVYIKNIVKRMSKPKIKFALRTSAPNSMTLEEQKRFVLQGFPNVGASMSEKLLEEYKTLMNLFNNINKIDEISGVGKTTKQKFIDILNK